MPPRTLKILLVDDEPGVRITMRIALARLGFDVTAVADGVEALRLLGREAFDWLITDGHMAPTDGFQLARDARLLRPELRVVMITGAYLKHALEEAIDRVFIKPVDDDALAAYLRKPLNGASI